MAVSDAKAMCIDHVRKEGAKPLYCEGGRRGRRGQDGRACMRVWSGAHLTLAIEARVRGVRVELDGYLIDAIK